MNTKPDESALPRRDLLWVFGFIAWRCVREGIWRGALYGLGYGFLYVAWDQWPFFWDAGITGLQSGFVLGTLAGVLLGLLDACILGGMSVLWAVRPGWAAMRTNVVERIGYRRAFLLLAFITTSVGGVFTFPVIFALPGSTLSGRAGTFLVLVPSLIAGIAALQASGRVIPWYEENVGLVGEEKEEGTM